MKKVNNLHRFSEKNYPSILRTTNTLIDTKT